MSSLGKGARWARGDPHLTRAERARLNRVAPETQRKVDLLARDFPELHARVIAGELSADRAGKIAGFLRETTDWELLRRAWRKASPAERQRFREWTQEENP